MGPFTLGSKVKHDFNFLCPKKYSLHIGIEVANYCNVSINHDG